MQVSHSNKLILLFAALLGPGAWAETPGCEEFFKNDPIGPAVIPSGLPSEAALGDDASKIDAKGWGEKEKFKFPALEAFTKKEKDEAEALLTQIQEYYQSYAASQKRDSETAARLGRIYAPTGAVTAPGAEQYFGPAEIRHCAIQGIDTQLKDLQVAQEKLAGWVKQASGRDLALPQSKEPKDLQPGKPLEPTGELGAQMAYVWDDLKDSGNDFRIFEMRPDQKGSTKPSVRFDQHNLSDDYESRRPGSLFFLGDKRFAEFGERVAGQSRTKLDPISSDKCKGPDDSQRATEMEGQDLPLDCEELIKARLAQGEKRLQCANEAAARAAEAVGPELRQVGQVAEKYWNDMNAKIAHLQEQRAHHEKWKGENEKSYKQIRGAQIDPGTYNCARPPVPVPVPMPSQGPFIEPDLPDPGPETPGGPGGPEGGPTAGEGEGTGQSLADMASQLIGDVTKAIADAQQEKKPEEKKREVGKLPANGIGGGSGSPFQISGSRSSSLGGASPTQLAPQQAAGTAAPDQPGLPSTNVPGNPGNGFDQKNNEVAATDPGPVPAAFQEAGSGGGGGGGGGSFSPSGGGTGVSSPYEMYQKDQPGRQYAKLLANSGAYEGTRAPGGKGGSESGGGLGSFFSKQATGDSAPLDFGAKKAGVASATGDGISSDRRASLFDRVSHTYGEMTKRGRLGI